jgi:hypothetical protein
LWDVSSHLSGPKGIAQHLVRSIRLLEDTDEEPGRSPMPERNRVPHHRHQQVIERVGDSEDAGSVVVIVPMFETVRRGR